MRRLFDVVYHSTDAAATDGGLKLAVEFFHRAGGVKSFGQQNDPVQKEEGSDAVDDVLHELNSEQTENTTLYFHPNHQENSLVS